MVVQYVAAIHFIIQRMSEISIQPGLIVMVQLVLGYYVYDYCAMYNVCMYIYKWAADYNSL